jgi:hypothetical protein
VLQPGDLHIAERDQNVFFGGEIVKKGALSNVRRVGDVLDGSFRKPFIREKVESGAKKSLAKLLPAPLPPIAGNLRLRFLCRTRHHCL